MEKSEISISCPDGYVLAGTLYKPDVLKGAVMIAPATGIKRVFYNSFASYLAEHDYGVICFDNRGIGDSVKHSIKDVNASLIDWGSLDMPAVLEKLKNLFPSVSYHLIGHSAGGQLAGLMNNAKDISSMFNFASSSGSLSNMHYPFKLQAYFFLNVFIPLNNLLFGYTKTHWLGMGEPLPKMVAYQWQKWCKGKGYVAMDFGQTIQKHSYNELEIPSQWLHATDDPIANYENVQDMLKVYPMMVSEVITLEPKKLGYKDIGHMKFFSSKYKNLWSYTLNWLDKNCLISKATHIHS
ncbi:Predicted hydrolase of the alpha/beta-hydrolase fold [Legionella busanensis]|uniref:Predicted hydrolase of the alpha/beta-hydrolase fold n=1 Tax=Legionella busanensis TaxID=190655 RepID=A0A378KCH4_9GAMM|nr:alpha/beta fold hydrolase [Legionella busanensis]STX81315.1 Predicted hydrolase of the alpha/beta-hydrolase fold [Legionella busanensis]